MYCHGPMFGNDGRLDKGAKMKTPVDGNSRAKPSRTKGME